MIIRAECNSLPGTIWVKVYLPNNYLADEFYGTCQVKDLPDFCYDIGAEVQDAIVEPCDLEGNPIALEEVLSHAALHR